ncbi:MAG: tfuA protein [Deltaproteobacteria bacterium]|nr:tfuA protein [Deltaproteobacteria bacterium]
MTTLVFVGPTLAADEVARRLPGAEVRPPVSVGDVLALLSRAGRRVTRIAIIDGYFERMAAVWHKELLLAVERGVEVWGAASMGALRAAELAPFGMRGVGAIYRAYVRGALGKPGAVCSGLPPLVADDEVAVAHLPAEAGYRAVSDALVNLRSGLAAAPFLSARTRDRLIELARERFYRERSWAQLITDGRAARLPPAELAALEAWRKPDRKAADARLLVRTLARSAPHRRSSHALRVPRTWAIRQLGPVPRLRNR